MNESLNKRTVIVGVFILVGIFFLLAGILTIGNLHQTFSKKLRIISLFDDVNGLQKGNNIWFSGVKIGTVKRIDFIGKSQVKVIMNIDEDTKEYIRKDANVKVSTDGFIGNKILVIYGGTANSNAVNKDDTLSVEKTFTTEDMMNTFQENNTNILAITKNLKTISKSLVDGKGSIGKLLKNEEIYNNISATSKALKNATNIMQQITTSLLSFTSKLNKKGTLANELATDTIIFNSIKKTMFELKQVADTAAVFISNLNTSSKNPKSPIGILLNDEEAGSNLKSTLKNLDSGSKKLDEDLEALQHNILLRRYFNKNKK